MRKYFHTPDTDEYLRANYPHMLTADIAKYLGMSLRVAYNRAWFLGLRKTKEFVAETSRERFLDPNHPGRKYVYKKGHKPANKGKKQTAYMSQEAIDRTKATRFKKGNLPHNTAPGNGHISMRKDNRGIPHKFIRIALGKWVHLSVFTWEKENGKLPVSCVISFRDGNPLNCDIDNLECITRAEHLRRNRYNLRTLVVEQARRAIQHQIRNIKKQTEWQETNS